MLEFRERPGGGGCHFQGVKRKGSAGVRTLTNPSDSREKRLDRAGLAAILPELAVDPRIPPGSRGKPYLCL